MKNLKKAPDLCLFKQSKKAEVLQYTPEAIMGFRIDDGQYFVSREVMIDGQKRRVFLEFLINGIADLYYLKDTTGTRYFLQNEGETLMELKNSKTKVVGGGKVTIDEKKEYVGILKSSFDNAPELEPAIERASFVSNDLVKVVQEYHEKTCDEYDCEVYRRSTNRSIGIAIIPSVSDVNFKVKSFNYRFLEGEQFESDLFFTAVVMYSESNFVGATQNLSFNTGAGFQKINYESENYEISQSNVVVPVFFSYSFPTGRLKPLLNLGFVNTLNLSTTFASKNEDPNVNRLEGTISFYQFKLTGGAGLRYDAQSLHYLLSLNYEAGTGINKSGAVANNALSSSTTAWGVSLGVLIDLFSN